MHYALLKNIKHKKPLHRLRDNKIGHVINFQKKLKTFIQYIYNIIRERRSHRLTRKTEACISQHRENPNNQMGLQAAHEVPAVEASL